MSLFENFPYTNLHNLNLDWLIKAMQELQDNAVLSVNGMTGEVVLYEDATVEFPEIQTSEWKIVRTADGTEIGLIFGSDMKLYLVHGNTQNQIYTSNNQPPYPVTSVNNQTGNITLYTDRSVRFPDLSDADIHSWNIFRLMNSVASGIEFDEAGDAYIVFGNQRYKLYSTRENSTVVNTVNGQSGTAVLFTDSDGEVTFPEYTSANIHAWEIRRSVNNHMVGLMIGETGNLTLMIDDAPYTVYTSLNPQPDWVNDPTAAMIQISAPTTGSMWGFIRNTSNAPVGIMFDNTLQDSPKAYVQYTDSNNVVQTVQLITLADIPQSSVISVNGQGGLVVLTGADIDVSGSDNRKINTVLASLETAKQTNRQAMAYNETSNTASNDIPAGAYVFWNNGAYVASQNISYGDTLSSSNLTAVVDQYNQPCGFANALNNKLTSLANSLCIIEESRFYGLSVDVQANRKQVLEYLWANTQTDRPITAYVKYADGYHSNYYGMNVGNNGGSFIIEILEYNYEVNIWYLNAQGTAEFIKKIS